MHHTILVAIGATSAKVKVCARFFFSFFLVVFSKANNSEYLYEILREKKRLLQKLFKCFNRSKGWIVCAVRNAKFAANISNLGRTFQHKELKTSSIGLNDGR